MVQSVEDKPVNNESAHVYNARALYTQIQRGGEDQNARSKPT